MAKKTVQLEYFQYLEIISALTLIAGTLEEMHGTLKELRDETRTTTNTHGSATDHKQGDDAAN